jgi:hypothetical protein
MPTEIEFDFRQTTNSWTLIHKAKHKQQAHCNKLAPKDIFFWENTWKNRA